MNKQCQEPQAHPDRCGCVREIAEHNAQAYAEAIAALAAKDARIAELERDARRLKYALENGWPMCRRTIRPYQGNPFWTYDEKADGGYSTALHAIDAALSSQQQAEPKPLSQFVAECEARDPQMMAEAREWAKTVAPLSEDGGEVPEVVAWIRGSGLEMLRSGDGIATVFRSEHASNHSTPLMTVAQHSRIVAALKAEITRLKTDLPGDTVADRLDRLADHSEPGSQRQADLYAAATVWRKHLAARPARQVGEVITEHNGCGRGAQVDQLTVRLYPGDKVVMLRGPLGLAMTRRDEK